ncbi:MAG: ATP-binding protein, partial [Oscillospiraceae bacterium]|nr:ATP-binding protein [Oscillospiraceae bacterium]
MVNIKEIRIKNFRSLVDITLSPTNLNVFVGMNDSGKSNILKALNLFFNNQTDDNREFDFNTDYSKLAPQKAKKAKEIKIILKVIIPNSYRNKGEYVWTKVWRGDKTEPFFDSLYDDKKSGKVFTPRSKATTFLERIQFCYVPATKSGEYFSRLLGELYATISQDAKSDISVKTIDYSNAVQLFTSQISNTLRDTIGIESALVMPPNQVDVFKLFTFKTKDASQNDVFLEQRGDGIKSRHIPAILEFVSKYKSTIYQNSSVPSNTIWGYEEPETGIEMSRCFDCSKEFLTYSKDINIFLTTHSPAFYSLEHENDSKVFYISKNDKSGETTAT